MIEFLKQNKMIVIVILGIAIFIGWNIFNAKEETIESNTFLETDLELKEEKIQEKTQEIIVHIAGEVKNPGIVKVKYGSRIEDLINEAGGLTEKADITSVNLAYVVEDGTKIVIPSIEDEKKSMGSYIIEGSGEKNIISTENIDSSTKNIININTATKEELQALPGIGASIANKIIEYRKENGKFKTIEDIKNVSGIGTNKFEKIKKYIKV